MLDTALGEVMELMRRFLGRFDSVLRLRPSAARKTSSFRVGLAVRGLGFLLRFFNASFSKRSVWGSRRPADYDQKYIEDEERNGNVVEESRLR
jgi:hypothetical protein